MKVVRVDLKPTRAFLLRDNGPISDVQAEVMAQLAMGLGMSRDEFFEKAEGFRSEAQRTQMEAAWERSAQLIRADIQAGPLPPRDQWVERTLTRGGKVSSTWASLNKAIREYGAGPVDDAIGKMLPMEQWPASPFGYLLGILKGPKVQTDAIKTPKPNHVHMGQSALSGCPECRVIMNTRAQEQGLPLPY